jgi:CBS domain-containing protein
MPSVRDILAIKGPHVQSIGPSSSALAAALVMNEHKIGSLVVLNGGELVGIITERDLLQRIIAERRDPATTLVQGVMTSEVVCCRTYSSLDEVRGVMKNRRIRHLPVVDDDRRVLGLVSIGDLNAYLAHDQEVTIHVMEDYIHGRA